MIEERNCLPDFTVRQGLSCEGAQPGRPRAATTRTVARGQNIRATYVARKLCGGNLGEAEQMVDSLRENKAPQ